MNEKRKFMDWLWLLHSFGLISDEDLDQQAGRLYGFNQCCIDNYKALRKAGISGVGAYMDNLYGADDLDDILSNPHVRCIKCRKGDLHVGEKSSTNS